jgi:murein DD-endopeptidase MepM/ murein hydrolase activator NlpD
MPPIRWRRPTVLEIVEFGGENLGFETMRVTSPFGNRPNPLFPEHSSSRTTFHDGLDIGNHREGDEVVAAADGKVIAVGALLEPWSQRAPAGSNWEGGNYGGLMVVIDHGSKTVSVSAHMRKILVTQGAGVTAGKVIGEVGDTGSAKGQAHVHFGVLEDGDPVDPWPLIILGGLSREERLAREVVALRAEHPAAAARWIRNTGLKVSEDGQPIRREVRLAAEVTFLREVDKGASG